MGNPLVLRPVRYDLLPIMAHPSHSMVLSCPLICRPGNGKKPGRIQSKWYVADTPGPAILGLPACESLQVITLNCAVHITHIVSVTLGNKEQPKAPLIPMGNAEKQQTFSLPNPSGKILTKKQLIEEYPDCFKGIGRFPGTHKIHLQEGGRKTSDSPSVEMANSNA